jgi:hypothetical protein
LKELFIWRRGREKKRKKMSEKSHLSFLTRCFYCSFLYKIAKFVCRPITVLQGFKSRFPFPFLATNLCDIYHFFFFRNPIRITECSSSYFTRCNLFVEILLCGYQCV